MSFLDTKQALIKKLIGGTYTGITASDIAYENNSFNPDGKSKYIATYFIPATTESTGKTSASGDEQRGIFQVSVFVKLLDGVLANDQLQIIDDIISEFQYGSTTVYNNQTVDILESTVNAGFENESWFKRDISIDYLTFSERS